MQQRKDTWSEKEDEILAELVLGQIKTGGTQLKAFELAGCELNRTAAACGFRWNGKVRKLYKIEVEKAKEERSFARATERKEPAFRDGKHEIEAIEAMLEKALHECKRWKSNIRRYEGELTAYKQKYEELNEEHQSLLGLINRAYTSSMSK